MPEVTLRGALPPLLLPPLALMLVVLAGGLVGLRRPRAGLVLSGGAALLLLALATPAASNLLRASLERGVAAAPPGAVAGAIIVLGGDVARGAGGPEIGRFTLERLRRGAALHRATGLPILVAGGRLAPDEPPLAQLMADSLVADFGVPVRWREEASRTTGENAILAAALLREAGIGAAHLVTHAWHLRRAQAEFAAAGVVVLPVPVGPAATVRLAPPDLIPRADRLAESWWAIREWAGLLVRRVAP